MNDVKKEKTFNEVLIELNQKTFTDPAFKEQYLKDPKSVIEKTLGIKLPADFEVCIYENTPKKLNIALGIDPSSIELSDKQLELVSGGLWSAVIAAIPAIITATTTLAGTIATIVMDSRRQ